MTQSPVTQERRTSERRSFSSFNGIKVDRRSGFDRRTEQHEPEAAWDAGPQRAVARRSGQQRRVATDRRSSENS